MTSPLLEAGALPSLALKLIASGPILGVATLLVAKYVIRYDLHYNEAAFTNPVRGAANYWAMGGWLLLHVTAGMADLAIAKRPIAVPKEWMARAHMIIFAFVTFRVLHDDSPYPGARLQPATDRAETFVWLSWALPLQVWEVILQWWQMRGPALSTR